MVNGFYNVMTLSEQQKEDFIVEAIENAFLIQCQSKYKGNSHRREIDMDSSVQFFIDNLNTMKIDAVDRVIYNRGDITEDVLGVNAYEICASRTSPDYWQLLYINTNRNNFYKLIGKFNLKLIEW